MKLTSQQLFFAACNIIANNVHSMSSEEAIKIAKTIASKIDEEPNTIPLQEVEDEVRFILSKYDKPVGKYVISSLLQGEFGYSKGVADSMVDRCEFHGFIKNIGNEQKSLYELNDKPEKP